MHVYLIAPVTVTLGKTTDDLVLMIQVVMYIDIARTLDDLSCSVVMLPEQNKSH